METVSQNIASSPPQLCHANSVFVCVWGGGGGSIPVTVCFGTHKVYAIGPLAWPSRELAMSVRRHSNVLADGEG